MGSFYLVPLRGLWDLRKKLLKLELERMKERENPCVQKPPALVYSEIPIESNRVTERKYQSRKNCK